MTWTIRKASTIHPAALRTMKSGDRIQLATCKGTLVTKNSRELVVRSDDSQLHFITIKPCDTQS